MENRPHRKKSPSGKIITPPVKQPAGKSRPKKASLPDALTGPWLLLPLLALTALAFWPSLNNDFVNWDDIVYIMNNNMIRTVSAENITKIFSSFYMGNYHPFTLLSFMFDYQIAGLTSPTYHIHNLILHLLNTALVFLLAARLPGISRYLALFVALIFAVHPMHVESVAWISERKDLLYTFWYLLSLLAYTEWLKQRRLIWLPLSLLLFLFSLLSKAQAVTLPLVLILLDYLSARRFNLRMALGKIPFFAFALLFGIIAIYAQQADNSVNPVGLKVWESLFYGFYSIWVYLFKFLIPVQLTCLYEYPFTAGHTIPWYVWASPLIIPVLAAVLWFTRKSRPLTAFGILFFLATIFPVLQFLPVGVAIVAERYTYIPYIGLAFVAIDLVGYLLRNQTTAIRRNTAFAGLAILLLFALLTRNRCEVWTDSVTLWTDVMEKNPETVAAYVNRGYMYNQYEQPQKAIDDCTRGLALDPDNAKLYYNRGIAWRKLKNDSLALLDFNAALNADSSSGDPYLDRGIIYTDVLGEYDKGIADFRKYLRYRIDNPNGNFNMAVAFLKKSQYDSALHYAENTMRLDPAMAAGPFITAVVHAAMANYPLAVEFATRARDMGHPVDPALIEQWKQAAATSQNPR